MGLLARTCLPVVLAFGMLAPAAIAEATSRPGICKAKKKKKAVKRKKRVKRAKPKVTARTIAKWQRKKMPHDQIVEKALAAGYKVTKAEKRKLLKLKVKKPLIARLENPVESEPALAAAAPATPKFDLDKTIDPNSIDFDSVPPPKGMPEGYAKKQREEAERKPAPAPAPKNDDKKEKRVVIAAGK
jgi:hypothetical protein